MPYGGNPAGSNNDALKFLVGDQSTSATTELLSTAECAYLIAHYGSVRAAAPAAARAIAAQFADQADKTVGDLSIAASQKARAYTDLAKSLERQTALVGVPYGGGLSISDKQGVEQDSDRVRPSFEIGQHDSVWNRQTGRSSTGLPT